MHLVHNGHCICKNDISGKCCNVVFVTSPPLPSPPLPSPPLPSPLLPSLPLHSPLLPLLNPSFPYIPLSFPSPPFPLQYYSEANEADSWMNEKAGLAASQDYGKDEAAATKYLKTHAVSLVTSVMQTQQLTSNSS